MSRDPVTGVENRVRLLAAANRATANAWLPSAFVALIVEVRVCDATQAFNVPRPPSIPGSSP